MSDALAAAFRTQAEHCQRTGSPLYARVCRELADEPVLDDIVGEVRWDVPLRLLGGVHYLALAEGIDPWDNLPAFLHERQEWLARFVTEQNVQTNEVQRCWALLPAFLSLADRPLDLVELGPSAGLNLLWDSYRYRYRAGAWGDEAAHVELRGDERMPVPDQLLARPVSVQRRRGIDLDPVDVTTEHGARLLECFVWADQRHRLEQLRRAIALLRERPPELIRGDFVEMLPALLAGRDPNTLTVVFQTAATSYLPRESHHALVRLLDAAAAEEPLGWISTRRPFEQETDRDDGYEVELGLRPEPPRLVAHMGAHGQWLEWQG